MSDVRLAMPCMNKCVTFRTPPPKWLTRTVNPAIVEKMTRQLLASPVLAQASATPVFFVCCALFGRPLFSQNVGSICSQWVFLEGVTTIEAATTIVNKLLEDPKTGDTKADVRSTFPVYIQNLHFWLIGGNHSVTAKKQALELRPSEELFRHTDVQLFINLDQGEMEKVN